MKDLKVITIDFWNTLFDSIDHEKRYKYRNDVLLEETDKLGIKVEYADLKSAIKQSWAFFEDNWIKNHHTPTSSEMVNVIWKYLKLPEQKVVFDKVVTCYEDSLFEYPPSLIDGVADVLPKMAKKYKLGLISDTGYSPGTHLRKLMEKNGILEYFSSFSFSNETGYSKPHENAFKVVLDELSASASEALHIGDIERTDIVGANNLGMYSALFTGTESEFDRNNPEKTSATISINHWSELIEPLNL
jgi:putative hydrolase of the HAD superfamily